MHYNTFKLFKSFNSLEKFVYLYNYIIHAIALIFHHKQCNYQSLIQWN